MADTSRRSFFEQSAAALVGMRAVDSPGVDGSLPAPNRLQDHLASSAIHAGEDSDCSVYPIYQGSNNHSIYSRNSNPTVASVEVKIAELEGAEQGVATACGMAAISTTLFSLVRAGSRVVYHRVTYTSTHTIMHQLKELGVETVPIDMTDPGNLRKSLDRRTDLVYFEVHTNPALEVIDAKACIGLAREAGAKVVIDNTWLTPCLLQPLSLGADVVLHSATKYMMGHGNGLAGIVCGSNKDMQAVLDTRTFLGTVLSPQNASLLHQGLKTLSLRMDRHCANAMQVAWFLENHPKVARVHYPGLPSHRGHSVARKQVSAFGGMVGFEMDDSLKIWERLKMIRPWWSLGDVESLLAPNEYREFTSRPYLRLSVGLEDPSEIIADLRQALDRT